MEAARRVASARVGPGSPPRSAATVGRKSAVQSAAVAPTPRPRTADRAALFRPASASDRVRPGMTGWGRPVMPGRRGRERRVGITRDGVRRSHVPRKPPSERNTPCRDG